MTACVNFYLCFCHNFRCQQNVILELWPYSHSPRQTCRRRGRGGACVGAANIVLWFVCLTSFVVWLDMFFKGDVSYMSKRPVEPNFVPQCFVVNPCLLEPYPWQCFEVLGQMIVNAQNMVCSWLYLPNVVPNRALPNLMPMFIEQWMHCDRSPFLCWCSHLIQAASLFYKDKVPQKYCETMAVWKDFSSHLSELFPMATTGPGKVDDVVWWSLHSQILTIPF